MVVQYVDTQGVKVISSAWRRKRRKEPRERWVKLCLGNRQQLEFYKSILQEVKRYGKAFKEFIRMEETQFEFLAETLSSVVLITMEL